MKRLAFVFSVWFVFGVAQGTGFLHYQINCEEILSDPQATPIKYEIVRASMSPPGGPVSQLLTINRQHGTSGSSVDVHAQVSTVIGPYEYGKTLMYVLTLKDPTNSKPAGYFHLHQYDGEAMIDIDFAKAPGFATRGAIGPFECKNHKRGPRPPVPHP